VRAAVFEAVAAVSESDCVSAEEAASLRRTAAAHKVLLDLHSTLAATAATRVVGAAATGLNVSDDSAAHAQVLVGLLHHLGPDYASRLAGLLTLVARECTPPSAGADVDAAPGGSAAVTPFSTPSSAAPPAAPALANASVEAFGVCSAGAWLAAFVPAVPDAALHRDIADSDLASLARLVFAAVEEPFGDRRTLEQALRAATLSRPSQVRLFCSWLLSRSPWILLRAHLLEYLPELLTLLLLQPASSSDGSADSTHAPGNADAAAPLIAEMRTAIFSSTNVPAALLLAAALAHPKFAPSSTTVHASQHASFPHLCADLEALCAVGIVRRRHGRPADLSLSLPQPLGETVAALLGELETPCAALAFALNGSHPTSTATVSAANSSCTSTELLAGSGDVALLHRHAQRVVESPLLRARLALVAAERWLASPSISMRSLAHAAEFAESVSSSSLRHGVALDLWQRALQPKLAALVALVEKTGKRPKDRLCLKDAGLEGSCVGGTVAAALVLLDVLESERAADMTPTTDYAPELQAIASLQATATARPLFGPHKALLQLLDLVFALDMRGVRLLPLFGPATRARFFSKLNSVENVPEAPTADDSNAGSSVTDALASASLMSLSAGSEQPTGVTTDVAAEAGRFFVQALMRAVAMAPARAEEIIAFATVGFGLPAGPLRSQYACNLLERGLHAEEALLLVRDQHEVAVCTVDIARRMLALFIADQSAQDPARRGEAAAHMSVELHAWVTESHPGQPDQCPVVLPPWPFVLAMLRRACMALSPGSEPFSRCQQLIACVEALDGTYQTTA
jgi:hypothetical protein